MLLKKKRGERGLSIFPALLKIKTNKGKRLASKEDSGIRQIRDITCVLIIVATKNEQYYRGIKLK